LGAVADYDERDWDLTLNVNAKSVFLGVKYAAPAPAPGRRRPGRQYGIDRRTPWRTRNDRLCRVQRAIRVPRKRP
jgi:hypothetical protein